MDLTEAQCRIIREACKDENGCQQIVGLMESVVAQAAQSENRFRQMFERNAAIKLLIDPADGRIVDANPAAAAFYGYDRDTLCRMRITDINVLTPAEVQAEMQRALDEERTFFAFRHRLASGEIRDVEVFSGPVDMPGKRYLYSIILDVTERKQAESALRENEILLRQITGNIRDVFFISDPASQRILYISPHFETFWGVSAEVLKRDRHAWMVRLHPDEDCERLRRLISFDDTPPDQMIAMLTRRKAECGDGPLLEYEYRMVRPDGDVRWIRVRSFGIENEAGRVYRIAGIAEDITEQKQMANALQTREEKLRQIIDQSVDGIVLTDSAGRIVVWNAGQERIAGIMRDEALGQYVWDVQMRLSPGTEDRDEAYTRLRMMIQAALESHDAPWFYHYMDRPIRRLDGEMRVMQTMAYPIHTSQGFMIGSLSRDVTELRQAQKTMHERELLQVALQKEQELNAFKREMMVRVAHEFRTPLTVIGTSSFMIERYLERMTPEQRGERVNHIRQQIDHLEHLLDELTIVVNGQDYHPGPFDLAALCRSLVETWNAQNPHTLHCEIRDHIPRLHGDETLMRRIIVNLLSNAVKFSDPSKVVRLTLTNVGDHIQIKVIDRGIGIPAREIDSVCEPFVRGSNLDERPGMGLGLTKTREAVLLNGGQLEIDSTVGVGTTVTVTLPLTRGM